MSRKPTPFIERPTWQRVKDLQEAASMARATIHNVLSLLEHAEKPEVQEAFRRQLSEAYSQLEDAAGLAT